MQASVKKKIAKFTTTPMMQALPYWVAAMLVGFFSVGFASSVSW